MDVVLILFIRDLILLSSAFYCFVLSPNAGDGFYSGSPRVHVALCEAAERRSLLLLLSSKPALQ